MFDGGSTAVQAFETHVDTTAKETVVETVDNAVGDTMVDAADKRVETYITERKGGCFWPSEGSCLELCLLAILTPLFTLANPAFQSENTAFKLAALVFALLLCLSGIVGKWVDWKYGKQHVPVRFAWGGWFWAICVFGTIVILTPIMTPFIVSNGCDAVLQLADLLIELAAWILLSCVVLTCCGNEHGDTMKEVWAVKMGMMRERKSVGGQAKYIAKNFGTMLKCGSCVTGIFGRARLYTYALGVTVLADPMMSLIANMTLIFRLVAAIFLCILDPPSLMRELIVCIRMRRRISSWDFEAFHPQWDWPGRPQFKLPSFMMPQIFSLPKPPYFDFPDLPDFMPRLPNLPGLPDLPALPNVDLSKFMPVMPSWDVDFPSFDLPTCDLLGELCIESCGLLADVLGDILTVLLLFFKCAMLAEKVRLLRPEAGASGGGEEQAKATPPAEASV